MSIFAVPRQTGNLEENAKVLGDEKQFRAFRRTENNRQNSAVGFLFVFFRCKARDGSILGKKSVMC